MSTSLGPQANPLAGVANQMVGTDDKPKDGSDAEESGIPVLYTYLGQFVDHDLTFDPASSLQQQSHPDGLVDYRTPKFDLDMSTAGHQAADARSGAK